MRRLEEFGLSMAGLTRVTGKLVGCYNNCLEQLGVAPTSLTTFRVDGMGWSPEIAEEKSDALYLAHSLASRFAIIVSLEQKGQPIFMPFTSYDREMMKQYFASHARAIADVLITTGLALDIDSEILSYSSPADLLLVDYVIVRSLAGDLLTAAHEQRQLENRFLKEPLAWSDRCLRQQIRESGRKYGNLTSRNLEIPEWRFREIQTFHTRAFGGVFVLRDLPKEIDDLLVLEDESLVKTGGRRKKDIFRLTDPELITTLQHADLFENSSWFLEGDHIRVLERRREEMIVDTLCVDDPAVDYGRLTLPQRRQRLASLQSSLPEMFFELERLIKRVQQGHLPPIGGMSPELRRILLRPATILSPAVKEVLWLLICRLQPTVDSLQLYRSDKDRFFALYSGWPEAKKVWAVRMLHEKYVHKTDLRQPA